MSHLGLLRAGNQAKVVFRMLQVTLGRNRIAGRLRVPRQLQIFLGDVMSIASDFDVRAIRLVGPRQGIWAFAISAVVAAVIGVTAAHALILTWSHRSSLGDIRPATARRPKPYGASASGAINLCLVAGAIRLSTLDPDGSYPVGAEP